jgi:hypothetical protein
VNGHNRQSKYLRNCFILATDEAVIYKQGSFYEKEQNALDQRRMKSVLLRE